MNQLCDHNDLFHWLEATRSYTINLFSCYFFNLDSWLIKTLTNCGSLFSLGLDGNMYFVGNNGCVIHTPIEMGYDQF